jgi:hypothetical protein
MYRGPLRYTRERHPFLREVGVALLISEYTAAELGDRLPLKPLQHVKVAGREAPLLIYTVEKVGDGTATSVIRVPKAPT